MRFSFAGGTGVLVAAMGPAAAKLARSLERHNYSRAAQRRYPEKIIGSNPQLAQAGQTKHCSNDKHDGRHPGHQDGTEIKHRTTVRKGAV